MSRKKTMLAEPGDASESDFVSRWSRLKHQAEKDAGASSAVNAAVTEAAENTELESARASSASVLTDEDMPAIESLTPDSDYADFFSPGVSEALRKLALRKLFHSDVFNIRDGLDEYDDDFTQFEKLGDIVTSDMRHQVELEAQRKAEQLLQHEDQSSDAGEVHDLETNDVHDLETNKDNDESVDGNIDMIAQDSALPDEAENGIEIEDDTRAAKKSIKEMSENHD